MNGPLFVLVNYTARHAASPLKRVKARRILRLRWGFIVA